MGNVIYLAGRDQPANVLLVEREPLMRSRLAAHLRKAGLSVVEAVNGAEVLKLLRAGRAVRVVLGDIDLGLATTLRRDFSQIDVVLGLAVGSPALPQTGFSTVRRPYEAGEVERTVKAFLGKPRSP